MPEDESSSEIVYVCCAERKRHNTQRHKHVINDYATRSIFHCVSPGAGGWVAGVRVTVKSCKGVDTRPKLNVQINCSRADLLPNCEYT